MDENLTRESTAKAIAAMTAWAGDHSGTDLQFVFETIWQYGQGPDKELPLLVGMMSLAGALLIRLEQATGVTPQKTLQEMALRYGPR